MKSIELLELSLVGLCLGVTFFCIGRLFFLMFKNKGLFNKFKKRLAAVDPIGYEKMFTMWGIPVTWNLFYSNKKYFLEKGADADPELLELDKKINAPIPYGLLTVLMIPGGFIAVCVVILIFDAFLKNLNSH